MTARSPGQIAYEEDVAHRPCYETGEPRKTLLTDGPFIEGKEHLGGFSIIDVPDLDAALAWGRRLSRATTLPIEVRPFRDGPPA